MPWVYLVCAGLLEVCWAVGISHTNGFTRPLPTLFTIATLIASMLLLAVAVRTIPISTAYPVWVGVGAVGAVAVGVLVMREPWSPAMLIFLALIGIGVVGLQSTSPGH